MHIELISAKRTPLMVLHCPLEMKEMLMEMAPEEMLAKFAETVPFPKRLGRPDEYASLAQHLLENTYINGEVVRMAGAQRFQPR